jgi:hypothetical protein
VLLIKTSVFCWNNNCVITKQMSPPCDRRKRRGEWLRGVFMKNNGWNADRPAGFQRATTSKWHASHFSPYGIRTDEREVLSSRASYAIRSVDRPGHVTQTSMVLMKYSAMDAPAQSVLMTWLNFVSLQSNTKTSRQVLKSSQAPVRYVPRVRYSGVTRLGL